MSEIIYFELNNWMPGEDFPNAEPFITWCANDFNLKFNSDEWCKENRLVVTHGTIDMSTNWCICATKEWVEENCPELLTKYTEFLRPDMHSHFGQPFLEYEECLFGCHWCDENLKTGVWEFYDDEDEVVEDD